MTEEKKLKLHFQRFEFKYQLPTGTVEGILPELLKYMEFDPYAEQLPGRAYTVASLYYDSAGLDCYHQKVAGLKMRKKLRIRFYDFDLKPNTPVFLEIKRKYDAVVVKDRLTMSYQNCYRALHENQPLQLDFSEHDQQTMDEFMWMKLYNGMMPQNMVLYDRKPLLGKVDPNFRVTIDSNLRTFPAQWLTDPGEPQLVNPGVSVLEVKFNNVLPAWFHRIIQQYSLEQRPFSKYCQSLELCHPELALGGITQAYQSQLAFSTAN